MTKFEELKAALSALPEGELLVQHEFDDEPDFIVWEHDKDAELVCVQEGNLELARFIALAHSMMPTLINALELVEIMAQMETDGDIQDRTDGDQCMSGDDATSTLSNLIERARGIQGELK